MKPELRCRTEDGRAVPTLVWRYPRPRLAISSGPLGGGIGPRYWVINATVPMSYQRLDPDRHLTEMAAELGCAGAGIGLLTGVDTSRYAYRADDGAAATATVGLGAPTWAAAPDPVLPSSVLPDPVLPGPGPALADPGSASVAGASPVRPGTVNLVVEVPVRLSPAALVNAVATVTEAKVQALVELGVPGTGTASDAVCVSCPLGGRAEPFGGPRSSWGARLARAAYLAVLAGGLDWQSSPTAWSS